MRCKACFHIVPSIAMQCREDMRLLIFPEASSAPHIHNDHHRCFLWNLLHLFLQYSKLGTYHEYHVTRENNPVYALHFICELVWKYSIFVGYNTFQEFNFHSSQRSDPVVETNSPCAILQSDNTHVIKRNNYGSFGEHPDMKGQLMDELLWKRGLAVYAIK